MLIKYLLLRTYNKQLFHCIAVIKENVAYLHKQGTYLHYCSETNLQKYYRYFLQTG